MPKKITIPGSGERWDEEKEEFLPPIDETTILIEHSLMSIAKWERIWHKCFLTNREPTDAEFKSYVKCMTITAGVDDSVYENLPLSIINEINEYMAEPMTACHFRKDNSPPSNETPTAEILYAQMVELRIPFECQKWHLNSLIALIKACALRQRDPKERTMSRGELARRNAELNRQRRERLHSRG